MQIMKMMLWHLNKTILTLEVMMNVKQQADYVIWSTLRSDDYAVALRFVDHCQKMSALYGTPVDEIVNAVNAKLTKYISRGADIDT